MALSDPSTVKETVRIGEYERPTPAMMAEFPHGRFPDVAFTYGTNKVVLEAQLATITLHGINGRRAFYDQHGSVLLWVTRNFDPSGPMRASARDILADQKGHVFSIDSDVQEESAQDGIFRLRVWTYNWENEEATWQNQVRTLNEIIEAVRPYVWCDDFKARFIAAFAGKSFYSDTLMANGFLDEALGRLGISREAVASERDNLLSILSLLISLEAGQVVGSRRSKLIEVANHFDYSGRHRYRNLVILAIRHWQPELLDVQSMQTAIARAQREMHFRSDKPFLRDSVIGRLRDELFPNWILDDPGELKSARLSAEAEHA